MQVEAAMLKIKYLFASALSLLFFNVAGVAAQSLAASPLTGVRLPAGFVRLNREDVPAEIREALSRLIALGNGKLDLEIIAQRP